MHRRTPVRLALITALVGSLVTPPSQADSSSSGPEASIFRVPERSGAAGIITTPDAVYRIRRSSVVTATDDGLLGFRFIGGRASKVQTRGRLDQSLSSYIGCNDSRWFSGAPARDALHLRSVYRGVDLSFTTTDDGNLLQRLRLAGSAAASRVKLAPIGGTFEVRDGDLIVRNATSQIRLSSDHSWIPGSNGARLGAARAATAPIALIASGGTLGLGLQLKHLDQNSGVTAVAGDMRRASSAIPSLLSAGDGLAAVGFVEGTEIEDLVLIGTRGGDLTTGAVAVSPDGHAIIGGSVRGGCNPESIIGLRGDPRPGFSWDAFMASVARDGVMRWADRFGSHGAGHEDGVTDLAIARDGTIAAIGYQGCPSCFPNVRPVQTAGGSNDGGAFLVARQPNGGVITSSTIGGWGLAHAVGFAGRDLLVVGESYRPDSIPVGRIVHGTPDPSGVEVVPGSSGLASVSNGDAFVHRIDLDSKKITETTFVGGTGQQLISDAAVSEDGHVAIALDEGLLYQRRQSKLVMLTPSAPTGAWTRSLDELSLEGRYVVESSFAPNGSIVLYSHTPIVCDLTLGQACGVGASLARLSGVDGSTISSREVWPEDLVAQNGSTLVLVENEGVFQVTSVRV